MDMGGYVWPCGHSGWEGDCGLPSLLGRLDLATCHSYWATNIYIQFENLEMCIISFINQKTEHRILM